MKGLFLAIGLLPLFHQSFASPWEEHGNLRTSANKHFIEHADGTPFLWVGDTGWGMIQQLTREEVDLYLDNRKSHGFNVIQTVAHWSPHGGGIDRSPANAENAYGHKPFQGSLDRPDTSKPLTQEGGSALAPNDYWDHMDYVMQAAAQRGLYVALLPVWGSELITGEDLYTEEAARSFGRFLSNRYHNNGNVIWILGGDTKAKLQGYNKHQQYIDYDFRTVYRSMAEGILQGASGTTLSWDTASDAWDEVFISYHPNGDYPYGSAQWFHSDPWLDANGVEVWKEVDDVHRAMLDDYQRTDPVKPSLFLEGSYEFGTYRHECGWITPLKIRRQFYQTFFAGGAGHTYGAAPIWAMRGNAGDYNCGYTWQQALNFPGTAQVAKIGKQFLHEYDWHTWQPHGGLISYAGIGFEHKAAVVSKDRQFAAVYFANNSHTTINNIFKKKAKLQWFNPINGQTADLAPLGKNESRLVAPPARWEDAILLLSI
jgi:hypothetical protein